MDESKELNYIDFGILSSDEIKRYSVCEITNSTLSGEGSIYDERMGPIENKLTCVTCEEDNIGCPGHFGHIELNTKIIHPLHYKYVVGLLKCFCYYCSKPLISINRMKLEGIYQNTSGITRYKQILKLVDNTLMCSECHKTQPNFEFSLIESNIYIYFNEKSKKALVSINKIWEILSGIDEEYLKTLGISTNSHPKNLVLECIPVLPTCARPYVLQGGKKCDDDLSCKYIEIIKMNNKLKDIKKCGEIKKRKLITSLEFHIKTLMDNTKGKARHQNGNRPIKCLKQRLCGKEGLIRKHLNGKRTDFSARTVIGGDPTLSIEQVGIPIEISEILTIPVTVNDININYLTELLWNDKINNIERDGKNLRMKYALYYPETTLLNGDIVVRNGSRINIEKYETIKERKFILEEGDEIIRYNTFNKRNDIIKNIRFKRRKNFSLQNGDIIYRHLQDGDKVILNRQPTLHKMSMMSMYAKILPKGVKTFKLPLPICGSFNADFDGDEMNIFPALSPQSQAEMICQSTVKKNMISGQANSTIVKISQDELLGTYLLTHDGHVNRDLFFDVVMVNNWNFDLLERMEHISKIFKEFGMDGSVYNKNNKYNPQDNIWDGKAIFSLVLPITFDWITDKITIKQGVLVKGEMQKKPLNNIINLLYKEYSPEEAVRFVDQTTMMANEYLVHRTFSVGISACCPPELDLSEIKNGVCKFIIEALAELKNDNYPKELREMRVNMVLNNAKSVGQKMAHDTIDPENPFNVMVRAGSKGSDVNIAQITSLLGQINVSGGRIVGDRSGGTRPLCHYEPNLEENSLLNEDISIKELLKVFESKGFIMSSFVGGLNPIEFWFSAMGGREGVCDTATKTSESGYIERRMVKFSEDLKIAYDGTVRNCSNQIVQFSYGGDGLDPSKTVHPKNCGSKRPQIMDVGRMVKQLENEIELGI